MIKVADNRLSEWFAEDSHAMLPQHFPDHCQLCNVAEMTFTSATIDVDLGK